jgi:hypothetical protein
MYKCEVCGKGAKCHLWLYGDDEPHHYCIKCYNKYTNEATK